MTAAAMWWVNTVTVTPYLGTRNGQPYYGDSQTIQCWVEDETKEVRNAAGTEVVSSSSVYAPLDTAALFPPGSKVTTASRTAFVISTNRYDSGSLTLGVDHVRVDLT